MISLGEKIKNIRLDLGETMETFGERFNTSKGTVNNWEKDRNRPNKNNLKIIADAANISVSELLDNVGNYTLNLEKYMFEVFESYYKKNIKSIKTEVMLHVGALSTSLGLKADGEHIEEYDEHYQFFNEFKEYAINYIKKNYGSYSYEDFLVNHPGADLIDFQNYKETEWKKTKKIFDKIIENYKAEFTESNAVWIQRNFTSKINDDLTGIKISASKKGQKYEYLEQLIQPILDEAAKKIKKINHDLNKD